MKKLEASVERKKREIHYKETEHGRPGKRRLKFEDCEGPLTEKRVVKKFIEIDENILNEIDDYITDNSGGNYEYNDNAIDRDREVNKISRSAIIKKKNKKEGNSVTLKLNSN